MQQREIEWRDLNGGDPLTEPGNYPVEGIGVVAVQQRYIDYVRENGEQWGFVIKKTPEDELWRITRIVRGL